MNNYPRNLTTHTINNLRLNLSIYFSPTISSLSVSIVPLFRTLKVFGYNTWRLKIMTPWSDLSLSLFWFQCHLNILIQRHIWTNPIDKENGIQYYPHFFGTKWWFKLITPAVQGYFLITVHLATCFNSILQFHFNVVSILFRIFYHHEQTLYEA